MVLSPAWFSFLFLWNIFLPLCKFMVIWKRKFSITTFNRFVWPTGTSVRTHFQLEWLLCLPGWLSSPVSMYCKSRIFRTHWVFECWGPLTCRTHELFVQPLNCNANETVALHSYVWNFCMEAAAYEIYENKKHTTRSGFTVHKTFCCFLVFFFCWSLYLARCLLLSLERFTLCWCWISYAATVCSKAFASVAKVFQTVCLSKSSASGKIRFFSFFYFVMYYMQSSLLPVLGKVISSGDESAWKVYLFIIIIPEQMPEQGLSLPWNLPTFFCNIQSNLQDLWPVLRLPDATQITWPCPWTCDRRSGAFSFLRPGRALSHSTSGAGGCRWQGSPTINHVRGVVSTPRYIAPPYRGSNGDPVAETASQSQGRTLGNGFSCLISLPTNLKKKKNRSLYTIPFFTHSFHQQPHARTSHGKLPTKLGPVSFSLPYLVHDKPFFFSSLSI